MMAFYGQVPWLDEDSINTNFLVSSFSSIIIINKLHLAENFKSEL